MADSPESIQPNRHENSLEIQTSKENSRNTLLFRKRVQLELTNAFQYLKKTVQASNLFSSNQKRPEKDENVSVQIENSSFPSKSLNPSTIDERRESKDSQNLSSRNGSNEQRIDGPNSPTIQIGEVKDNLKPDPDNSMTPMRNRGQSYVRLPPPETISKNWQTLKRKFFLQYRFIDKTHRLLQQKMTATMLGTSSMDQIQDKRSCYDKILILPNSRSKWIWDIIISFNSVIQGISAFYMIGFVKFENNHLDDTMLWIFIALDSMILTDMILCLFTAYYIGPDLIRSPKKIILRYVKRRMIIDIAMIIPLYRYFIEGLALKTLRISRWLFLMDQFSALVHYLGTHIKSYQMRLIILVLSRVLRTVLWIGMAIHILTCLSSFIVRYITGTFFFSKGGQNTISGYIQGCYFIVYTMAGVGYGDVTIGFDNNAEIFVGIYLQFIALGVFIFAISSISKDFKLFGLKSIIGEEKAGLERWFFTIERGHFSKEPIREQIVRDAEAVVMENLENNLNVLVNNPQYLPKLGPNLRVELTLGIFRDFCETYPFFFDLLERRARAEFLLSLKQKTYLPNTMILNGKQKPDGLYFLQTGILYTTPVHNHKIFKSRYIDHGIFGEELLTNEATPYGLRTGKRYATCFFLGSRKVLKFVENLKINKGIIQEQLKLGRLDPKVAFNNMFSVGASLADEHGQKEQISSVRPRTGTKVRRDAKIISSEDFPKFSNRMAVDNVLDDIKVELRPKSGSNANKKASVDMAKIKETSKEEEKKVVSEEVSKETKKDFIKGLIKLELPELSDTFI